MSPLGQRLRSLLALGRLNEQFSDAHAQQVRQPIQQIDGRVSLLPLDLTDVGAINPGVGGKPLLRHAARGPQSPKIPRQQRPTIHRGKRQGPGWLNHGL